MRPAVASRHRADRLETKRSAVVGPADTGQGDKLGELGTRPSTSAGRSQAPAALPADQVLKGHGDKVVKLDLDADYVHIADITHQGRSNFVVSALDGSGTMLDLLVNEIGGYAGVRLLDVRRTPAALKVQADGAWTITIKVAQKAPRWSGRGSGKGAAVLVVDGGAVTGLTTVTITHQGRSNFAVFAYGDGVYDLLVNEIGSYSGEVVVPSGTVLLDVQADGAWTIVKS